jgi:hypothetical protein
MDVTRSDLDFLGEARSALRSCMSAGRIPYRVLVAFVKYRVLGE